MNTTISKEIISKEIIEDFNKKSDIVREVIFKEIERTKYLDICLDNKNILIDCLRHQANRMEVARRVFNIFATTGEVKVPE